MKRDNKDLLRAMSDIDDKFIQEVLNEDLDDESIQKTLNENFDDKHIQDALDALTKEETDKVVDINVSKRRRRKAIWSVVAVAAACFLGFAAINVLDIGVKTSYETASTDSAAPAGGDGAAVPQSVDSAPKSEESSESADDSMEMAPIHEGDAAVNSAQIGGAESAQESAEPAEDAASIDEQAQAGEEAESDNDIKDAESEIYEAKIPELGLTLKVNDPTATGATLVWKQKGGNATGSIEFSKAYRIERFDGTKWTLVDIDDDVAFEDIAMNIEEDGTTKYELDWSSVYGELPSGTYRIVMTVNDYRGAGDYDTYTITAEFDL